MLRSVSSARAVRPVVQDNNVAIRVENLDRATDAVIRRFAQGTDPTAFQFGTGGVDILDSQGDPGRRRLRVDGFAAFEGQGDVAAVEFRPVPFFAVEFLPQTQDVPVKLRRLR